MSEKYIATNKKGTFYNITKKNLSYRSLVQNPTFSTTTKALQMAGYSPVTKSALLENDDFNQALESFQVES